MRRNGKKAPGRNTGKAGGEKKGEKRVTVFINPTRLNGKNGGGPKGRRGRFCGKKRGGFITDAEEKPRTLLLRLVFY